MTKTTSNSPIHADKLLESLELWVELTGVDPSGKDFSMKLGGGMDIT